MSAYGQFTTVMCETEHLVAALAAAGYKTVEVHETPQPLVGFMGDKRADRAHVIIRRKYVGDGSNDVGFVRGPDGRFRAIVSDFDNGRYGQKWLGQLAQHYTESRTMAVARAKGYLFRGRELVETDQGQQVRLRFAVR